MSNRFARVAVTGVAGGYAVSVVVLSYLNASALRAAATSLTLPSPAARYALGELALASSAALFATVLVGRRRGARKQGADESQIADCGLRTTDGRGWRG